MSKFKDFPKRDISFVPLDNMCTGCGICSAVCPHDAISMPLDGQKGMYQAVVDREKCTDCTLCLYSCPPLTWSNTPHTETSNELVGDYLSVYAAHSNDEKIRFEAASGGFITSFLICLLESGIIQGAIVVQRDEDNPLISTPFVATTANEIRNAKGSKYSPVKYDAIIKEVFENDYEDLALVGLPCHIEAIAKAIKTKKKLRGKIKLTISLVCGQSPSLLAYEYISNKFDIKSGDIKKLDNRGKGWPGQMRIETITEKISMPYTSKYSMGMVLSSPLFTPVSCQMCPDPVGFDADISVSDAWLDKYQKMDQNQGVNLVLVKNPMMIDFLEKAHADGAISLIKETVESYLDANRSLMENKVFSHRLRLKRFVDENKDLYTRDINSQKKLSWVKQLKLFVFHIHLRIIQKVNLQNRIKYINDWILFYFKFVNLMKK